MFKKLSETFTATHFVALVGMVTLAPGALYATTTFTNVAIMDATNGTTASVLGHRLSVYDPIAGYTKNPSFAVNIVDTTNAAAGYHSIYTVPNGKVLLIKTISWSDYGNTEGNNSYYYLYNAASNNIYNTEGLHAADYVTATFEPGIIVRAGALNGYYVGGSGAGSRIYIQGYLIPADLVPAAATAEAAQQFVMSGKPSSPGRPQ